MTTTTYRQIPVEEAKPGDRVTITGEIGTSLDALWLEGGEIMISACDCDDTVSLARAGVTVTVERPVATTTEEPQGIGAVVRSPVRALVYVAYASADPARWRDPYSALAVERSWAEIIDRYGPVEVLSEGWTDARTAAAAARKAALVGGAA